MKNPFLLFIFLVSLFACNDKIPLQSSPSYGDSVSPARDTLSALSALPVVADTAVPACIAKKIDSIKQQPVWNPPAEIYAYLYDGRTVYLMSANCCDFFSTAVDSNCNYVCAPSGGFTGRGDGKCTDFFDKAKQIKLVWKDDRKRK